MSLTKFDDESQQVRLSMLKLPVEVEPNKNAHI